MLPDSFFGKTACCFTGHRPEGLRHLGGAQAPGMVDLRHRLLLAVEDAVRHGVTTFLTGGAAGFDTLAAEAVLAWRGDYPAIRLTLALPSRTQAEAYPPDMRKRYERILQAASNVFYATESDNGFLAMRRRNRYLVDHADCCIAYLKHMAGGTLYTVNYALDKGIPVWNLYESAGIC